MLHNVNKAKVLIYSSFAGSKIHVYGLYMYLLGNCMGEDTDSIPYSLPLCSSFIVRLKEH